MIKVTEFSFIGYPVSDIKRAREFYEGLFNLKPAMDMSTPDGAWVEYEVGPHTLALSTYWKPAAEGGPCLSFEVEDYDATLAALKAANVKFEMQSMETPVCHFALVRDPEGNQLFVHKRKPPTA